MPNKRRSNKRGRRRKRGSRGSVVKVPFSAIIIVTPAGGVASVNVAPTAAGLGIPRLTTVSDPFEKYKFRSFRFRVVQNGTGAATFDQVVAYVGKTATTVALTTLLELTETGNYSILSSGNTSNGNWVNVPKSILAGMLPWYQTQGGNAASDTEEDNQGTLYLLGSATQPIHLEVRGVIDLSMAADPANTPTPVGVLQKRIELMEERLRAAKLIDENERDRERAKLVALFPALGHLAPTKRVDSCKTG